MRSSGWLVFFFVGGRGPWREAKDGLEEGGCFNLWCRGETALTWLLARSPVTGSGCVAASPKDTFLTASCFFFFFFVASSFLRQHCADEAAYINPVYSPFVSVQLQLSSSCHGGTD